jgi:hypothetical protein
MSHLVFGVALEAMRSAVKRAQWAPAQAAADATA